MVRGVSLKSVEEPLENLVAMGAINLDELLEYRHINDRGCARLAAIHHTEEDAAALRKTLEGAKASLDIPFSFQEYDIAFHTALAAASHNRLAILVNDAVILLATERVERSVRTASRQQRAELNRKIYESHNRIFQAVVAGDVAEAGRCADAVVDLFRAQYPSPAQDA